MSQWLTGLIARDLASCDSSVANRLPVELVIYSASYELPLNVSRTLFDVVTMLSTLGAIPVDESRGYMMCMEIHSEDGILHHALVNGRIKVDMNMWAQDKQELRAHAAVAEMMQVLGEAAWRAIWSEPAPTGTLETDCAAEFAVSGMVFGKMNSRQERAARTMEAPGIPASK